MPYLWQEWHGRGMEAAVVIAAVVLCALLIIGLCLLTGAIIARCMILLVDGK